MGDIVSTSSLNASHGAEFYHPILTNVVYKKASQSSTGLTYGDVALTRGTRGFVEFAQLLAQERASNQERAPTHRLAKRTKATLEDVPSAVLVNIIDFMDVGTRASFIQTSRAHHKLKEASLRGRDDLISKLLEYIKGDLSLLPYQDRMLVQGTGPTIRSLKLTDVSFSLQMLRELAANFSQLESLSLTNTEGTMRMPNVYLQELGTRLKNLQSLCFTGFMLHQGDSFGLQPFKKLRQFRIDHGYCTANYQDSEFEELGKLTKLTDLKMRGVITFDAKPLEYLANLSNLEKLTISRHALHGSNPEVLKKFLSSFSRLTELNIELSEKGPVQLTFLEDIALSCANLKRLTVLNLNCTYRFEQLAKLTELEHLEFRDGTWFSRDILKSLDQFPKLQKIVIDKCAGIYTSDVEKARLSTKKMPEIKFTPVEDEGYATETDTDCDDEEVASPSKQGGRGKALPFCK